MMGQPYSTTFVSIHGTDSPTCGVNASPCFSLAAAYSNTVSGGLIKAIDANSYGANGLVIDKPITIDGSSLAVLQNNSPTGAPVITIMANCTIRGVVIQVANGDGISIPTSGLQVRLEDVTIQGVQGFFGNGVLVNSSGTDLTANHVTITGATNGIRTESPTIFSGDNLHIFDYTGIGIETQGGAAAIRDSVIRGPGTATTSIGIYVTGAGGSTGTSMVERSEISFNGTGLEADSSDSPGTLRVSNSVIASNGTGLLSSSGGQILSFRTNMFAGNTSDGAAPLGLSLK